MGQVIPISWKPYQAIPHSSKWDLLERVFLYIVWNSFVHHWEEKKVDAPSGSSQLLAAIEGDEQITKYTP